MTARRHLALIGLGGLLAAGILNTTPAHADSQDEARFLALAAQHGMVWGSADIAIRQGHAVCQELYAGKPLAAVAQDAFIYTDLTSMEMAATFVAISVVSFCDEFASGHGALV